MSRSSLLLSLMSVAALVLLVPACGGTGSCVASGGIVDECKQDWTKEECDDWTRQGVNGSKWTFGSKSCEELGFSVRCADGSYARTSATCG